MDKNIRRIENRLRDDPLVIVVPTDKTNSFRIVSTLDYIQWVNKHIAKPGQEISRLELTEIHQNALAFPEEIQPSLSINERKFIFESLLSKAVPLPKLLIKYHKALDDHGNCPMRLIIPATNITSAFPKVGYLGLKCILDEHKICYSCRTTVQASQLKSKLEKLHLKQSRSTIFSLDIIDMSSQ